MPEIERLFAIIRRNSSSDVIRESVWSIGKREGYRRGQMRETFPRIYRFHHANVRAMTFGADLTSRITLRFALVFGTMHARDCVRLWHGAGS